MIECVFDESVSDAVVMDVLLAAVRAEAAAAARRFASIAELTERRCASEEAQDRQYWSCDAWDCVAAEIGAAQMISPQQATRQMHQGLALRHRLPRVGALLAGGAITASMATLLCWRTHLIDDPTVLARVDTELAGAVTAWGPLSDAKLHNAVDAIVDGHDPAAVLAYRAAARGRDVGVGALEDTTGTASLWGRLTAVDAEVLTRRLAAMVATVCRADPRTMGNGVRMRWAS